MNKKNKKILLYIGLAILSFFSGNKFMSNYVEKSFSSPGFVVSLMFFFSFCYFFSRDFNKKTTKNKYNLVINT